MHFQHWQGQRAHVVSQGNQRYLYSQQQQQPTAVTAQVTQDDEDALGALPDGWEKKVKPFACLLNYRSFKLFFPLNRSNPTTEYTLLTTKTEPPSGRIHVLKGRR